MRRIDCTLPLTKYGIDCTNGYVVALRQRMLYVKRNLREEQPVVWGTDIDIIIMKKTIFVPLYEILGFQ